MVDRKKEEISSVPTVEELTVTTMSYLEYISGLLFSLFALFTAGLQQAASYERATKRQLERDGEDERGR